MLRRIKNVAKRLKFTAFLAGVKLIAPAIIMALAGFGVI